MMTTLIVPGLHGSGPTHWQSWMEKLIPDARRVKQDHWDEADLDKWARRVGEHIEASRGGVIIVAHSFGCLAAVRASADHHARIKGALLVAPADPKKFGVTNRLASTSLEFPCALVSSSNDPWVSLTTARYWSARWGCRFVDVGNAGHINVESGYGPWPEGYLLYQELRGIVSRYRGRQSRPPVASAYASLHDRTRDLHATAPVASGHTLNPLTRCAQRADVRRRVVHGLLSNSE